jgi:hypothetical protein
MSCLFSLVKFCLFWTSSLYFSGCSCSLYPLSTWQWYLLNLPDSLPVRFFLIYFSLNSQNALPLSSHWIHQIHCLLDFKGLRYRSVAIVSSLRAGGPRNRGSILGRGKKSFSFLHRHTSGVRPSSCPVVNGGLSPEMKRPGLETDHQAPYAPR